MAEAKGDITSIELKKYAGVVIEKYASEAGRQVNINMLTDFEIHLLELAYSNYRIGKEICLFANHIK